MGVVARPIPHHNFTGKVWLERVLKTRYINTATAHTNFSDDAIINDEIKSGQWRSLVHDPDTTIDDVKVLLESAYHLDEYIVDRLELYFITKIGTMGNTKNVVLEDDDIISSKTIRTEDDENLPARMLSINDVCIRVRNRIGDEVEDDVTCNSEYMIDAMKRVGKAIRTSYHWIPMDQPCYLVMDNAGGHGTKNAIEEYTNNLLTEFNIKVIFQVPRSPYTNVLDLGVWMSLQAVIEQKHYMKRATVTALTNTVMETWRGGDLNRVLTSVFGCLKVVLCNILKGGGGNELVEENRGVKHRNIKIEKVNRNELSKRNMNQPSQDNIFFVISRKSMRCNDANVKALTF